MDRYPSAPPIIRPLPRDLVRPLWSVMIPTYNAAAFLPETLASVLVQDPGPEAMQIEVVDDASTDADIEALVLRHGKGRVGYFRQPANVGSLRNFETCINRATGQLIHLLHADDKVLPGYYAKVGNLFRKFPSIGAAFSRFSYIDGSGAPLFPHGAEASEEGILDNWLVRIAHHQRVQFCAMTVKREAYERLGAFYGRTYAEDWVMWTRVARDYAVAYCPEVLAQYRMHDSSITGQAYAVGKNIDDLKWAIAEIQNYLPIAERRKARRAALRFFAYYAMGVARKAWISRGDKRVAKAQIRGAFRMYFDIGLLIMAVKLWGKFLLNHR
jgi:glycosyltransferase involved in cell wall biosynthesis